VRVIPHSCVCVCVLDIRQYDIVSLFTYLLKGKKGKGAYT